LLGQHPRDDSAKRTDVVFLAISGRRSTDHLFVSLLPNLDVLPAATIRDLSAVHTNVKGLVSQAEWVLKRGGSGQVAQAVTIPIWEAAEMLVDDLQRVHDELSRLADAPVFHILPWPFGH
jgi:hypothetical protein